MTFTFVAPADELQIRNLIARYAYAVDGGEKEAFASLFLEDGAWTRETSPPAALGGSGLPSQTIRGRTGLMDLIETAIIGRFQRKARVPLDAVSSSPPRSGMRPRRSRHLPPQTRPYDVCHDA